MTKMQIILQEISKLSLSELEEILQEIMHKVERKGEAEAALDKFIGSGEGLWETDAQKHIDKLRQNDRL